MIRDRIVFGVRARDTCTRPKEGLLRESADLTLENAATICRASEASSTQIQESEDCDKDLFHLIQGKFNQRRPKPPHSKQLFHCLNCGNKYLPKSCPAFGRLCLVCKGKYHFAKMCPIKCVLRVRAVNPSDQGAIGGDGSDVQSADVQELFIGTVTSTLRFEPACLLACCSFIQVRAPLHTLHTRL